MPNNTKEITCKLNKITRLIFLSNENIEVLANNRHVYAYLFNASGYDWIKMKRIDNNGYIGIVPAIQYDGVIFSFNFEDCGDFEKSSAQTTNCACKYIESGTQNLLQIACYNINNNRDDNNKLKIEIHNSTINLQQTKS